MIVEKFPDRTILVDNKKYLYFGGTSYLGLATNKSFQKIITKNIQKWGSAYGSSRSANIQLSVYEKAEKTLANFINSDAAVTLSSGMLAGKIVLELLQTKATTMYHFPNLHVALQTKESFPFYIENKLNPKLLTQTKETIVLLTDSFPTSSVLPINLQDISKISPSKKIILVIDESHSLGITGENGCGEFSSINFPNIHKKILISSLGKALGVTGGIIASDTEFIQEVKNFPSFISAAGMNPAFLNSIHNGIKLITKKQHQLMRNLKYFRSLLKDNSEVIFNENYPLLYPTNDNFTEKCLKNNIVIVNFKYPTPSGSLSRIVITANHKKKDLLKLATMFEQ